MNKNIKNIPIVFIGAGNLAVNLAVALYRKGFRIVQIYSRTEASAKALAEKTNAAWTTDLKEITRKAQLYIVALKDSALIELLPEIVCGKENALLVHTAGSIPLSIWEGQTPHYGVLYPLQTFSKQREVDFSEIPFFIESSHPENTELLMIIASTLSEKVYEVHSEQRRSLHLAAVFACNFTNHMYVLAADLLKECQLPFEIMLPLIDETAWKVHEISPIEAQTGPAVRYDESVIRKHLDMLANNPARKEIYQLLSASIHRYARENIPEQKTE